MFLSGPRLRSHSLDPSPIIAAGMAQSERHLAAPLSADRVGYARFIAEGEAETCEVRRPLRLRSAGRPTIWDGPAIRSASVNQTQPFRSFGEGGRELDWVEPVLGYGFSSQ